MGISKEEIYNYTQSQSICQDFSGKSSSFVRAERQRARANVWQTRAELLAALYIDEQSVSDKLRDKLREEGSREEEIYNNISKMLKAKDQEIRDLSARIDHARIAGREDGFNRGFKAGIESLAKKIEIADREIARRLKNRREKYAQKLVSGFELALDVEQVWIIRSIKRLCKSTASITIENNAKCPTEIGTCGHHTTPSGKTVVHSPNAYNCPTVYHRSTLEIIVGRRWIIKNIKKLALSEASVRVR